MAPELKVVEPTEALGLKVCEPEALGLRLCELGAFELEIDKIEAPDLRVAEPEAPLPYSQWLPTKLVDLRLFWLFPAFDHGDLNATSRICRNIFVNDLSVDFMRIAAAAAASLFLRPRVIELVKLSFLQIGEDQ